MAFLRGRWYRVRPGHDGLIAGRVTPRAGDYFTADSITDLDAAKSSLARLSLIALHDGGDYYSVVDNRIEAEGVRVPGEIVCYGCGARVRPVQTNLKAEAAVSSVGPNIISVKVRATFTCPNCNFQNVFARGTSLKRDSLYDAEGHKL